MPTVIDNGNPNPISELDEWTPTLNGEIYCSRACGFKCKKVDFDKATAKALELANQMGHGWEPRVWENGGWHYEVLKRGASVTAEDDGSYQASIRFYMDDKTEVCVSETRTSPVQAVEAVVDVLNARIKGLQRALNAVAPEPLQLTSDLQESGRVATVLRNG